MKKNYYRLLQVDRQAAPEVIEKAYKALCRKHHPDLQLSENKAQAEEFLKEINLAYQILKNPRTRASYNRRLRHEALKIWVNSGLLGLIKYWYEK